jgi:hypothetical protein
MTSDNVKQEDKGDDILKRMLKMPPDPKSLPKPKPGKDIEKEKE